MQELTSIFAILVGLLVRIAIPLVITIVVILILRRADARWQKEAEQLPPVVTVENPHCWDIKNCPAEQVNECPAPTSLAPCWQVRRQKNGYLREACLTCQIFRQAPLPTPVHS